MESFGRRKLEAALEDRFQSPTYQQKQRNSLTPRDGRGLERIARLLPLLFLPRVLPRKGGKKRERVKKEGGRLNTKKVHPSTTTSPLGSIANIHREKTGGDTKVRLCRGEKDYGSVLLSQFGRLKRGRGARLERTGGREKTAKKRGLQWPKASEHNSL